MATIRDKEQKGILRSLDWFTIILYIALMGMGWMSICGASYDFDQAGQLFSFSSRSGMQIIWILTSLGLGTILLTIDERIYESFAYLVYGAFIILLFATPFLAHDIKGSMSWIKIGTFSVQPAEFAKFGTALCLARVISSMEMNLSRTRDLIICTFLILLPMGLIIMQKETGSALVYLSFFFMFYREGMPGSILFCGVAAVFYFVVGIRFANEPFLGIPEISMGKFLVLLGIYIFTLAMTRIYTKAKSPFWWMLAWGTLTMGSTFAFSKFVIPFDVTIIQLAVCGIMVIYLLYLALRERLTNYLFLALFMLGSIGFSYSTNYVMDHMKSHQQKRIQVLLGMVDDPRDAGYNVAQAQIAIGSGGLKGKGFLNGTQTKLKYVPEQDTDFIFCTVGEEEGFVGCSVVLLLFLTLMLRLIHIAERQVYTFGRVYGYCVLGIFLLHVFINVGMVLGLTPVIGIPLPFFSYGGSSLWGFTILLFILLRIDAARNKLMRNK